MATSMRAKTIFPVVAILLILHICGAKELEVAAPIISEDNSPDEDLASRQNSDHVCIHSEVVKESGSHVTVTSSDDSGPQEETATDDQIMTTSDHAIPTVTTDDSSNFPDVRDSSHVLADAVPSEVAGDGEREGEDIVIVTDPLNDVMDPPPLLTRDSRLSSQEAIETDHPTDSDPHEAMQEATPTGATPPAEEEEEEEEEEVGDDVPTFTEFSQRKRMEQDSSQKPTPDKTAMPPLNTTGGNRNYASLDCGAKIVASNAEAQNPSAILSENRDVYMINPCSADIWVIVELCELVELHSLQIACFELFSSIPESFNVSVSERFPSDEWRCLGTMLASNEREIQSFPLRADESIYAKYVRVEMISHYGSEHFCPLSLLRVIGASMMEVYEYSESQQELQVEPSSPPTVAPVSDGGTVEDDIFAGVLEENISHGIMDATGASSLPGMLTGVVLSLLETVNDYISPRETSDDTANQGESESVAGPHQVSDENDGVATSDDSELNGDLVTDNITHGTETDDMMHGTVALTSPADVDNESQTTVHRPHSQSSVPSPDDITLSSTETTPTTNDIPTPSPSHVLPSHLPSNSRHDNDGKHESRSNTAESLIHDDSMAVTVGDDITVADASGSMVDIGHSVIHDGHSVVHDGHSVVAGGSSSSVVNNGHSVVDIDGLVASSGHSVVDAGHSVVTSSHSAVDIGPSVVVSGHSVVGNGAVNAGGTVVDDPELDEEDSSERSVKHSERTVVEASVTDDEVVSDKGDIDSHISDLVVEAVVESGTAGGVVERPLDNQGGPEETKNGHGDSEISSETELDQVNDQKDDDVGDEEAGEGVGVEEGGRNEEEQDGDKISGEGDEVPDDHETGGSHDSLNEGLTNGNGAGMLSGQQKEKSVFLRLSNRIRDLEDNMSLFSSYLDQISTGMKRNKNRTEDSQRSLEKRLNILNDSLQELTNQTGLTLLVLTELLAEMENVRETMTSVAEEMRLNRSVMWQYSVVILLALLVSMTLTMCWSQYSRTTRSHDSHVMQTNGTRRNMEYYDNGSLRTHHMMGGGGHVTGGDGHVISVEPPLWNGITKSSHIGNQTGLLGATESSLPTDQPWSRVVKKRKKKTKTL